MRSTLRLVATSIRRRRRGPLGISCTSSAGGGDGCGTLTVGVSTGPIRQGVVTRWINWWRNRRRTEW